LTALGGGHLSEEGKGTGAAAGTEDGILACTIVVSSFLTSVATIANFPPRATTGSAAGYANILP
jgi:hypothetical protein